MTHGCGKHDCTRDCPLFPVKDDACSKPDVGPRVLLGCLEVVWVVIRAMVMHGSNAMHRQSRILWEARKKPVRVRWSGGDFFFWSDFQHFQPPGPTHARHAHAKQGIQPFCLVHSTPDITLLSTCTHRRPETQQDPSLLRAVLDTELEHRVKGGFMSLGPLLPYDSEEQGWHVPWSGADLLVHQWHQERVQVLAAGVVSGQ